MTVMMKESLRHALGLLGVGLLLLVAWTQGYRSAAAKTLVQTVGRSEVPCGDAEAALAKARKQVQVLKNVIQRYQEELAYVDDLGTQLEAK
jgi:hypothetical protein